jgi:hypothetical protein
MNFGIELWKLSNNLFVLFAMYLNQIIFYTRVFFFASLPSSTFGLTSNGDHRYLALFVSDLSVSKHFKLLLKVHIVSSLKRYSITLYVNSHFCDHFWHIIFSEFLKKSHLLGICNFESSLKSPENAILHDKMHNFF